jgi:hypothetical protein
MMTARISVNRSSSDQLVSELREYDRQFAAVRRDAATLLEGLSEPQLEWREADGTWSIGDCLNHLVVTGNQSLSHIRRATAAARAQGLLSEGPFRHPIAGRLLVRLMDAPARIRFRAPQAFRPLDGASVSESVAGFWSLQTELARALGAANGIDLARVKVTNPVSNRFTLTLGQEFAFTAAHERRHLWQARSVREKLLHRRRTEA